MQESHVFNPSDINRINEIWLSCDICWLLLISCFVYQHLPANIGICLCIESKGL